MLTLSNTLSGKKEEFIPLEGKRVGMYNCGPTVYDSAHIGNLRSYVFADILRSALELNTYSVTQVINITDIGHLSSDADDGEDKMTKGLKREGKPLTLAAMKELADTYTEKFKNDLLELGIALPTHLPKASEHIKEDINLISTLEKKGFTYNTSDGVYFDTSKDADYGKLGGISTGHEETRIGTNSEKKNAKDFAVWKFNDTIGFESPWGKGFPGWHIECSAMSMKYLGETFDIHTGGIDHVSIHHNNEIAQSESATGKPYAHFWLHNAFVNIENGKMAKSEGNFITLATLKEKGIDPRSYRYWLLTARYNSPITFSWDALLGAEKALVRLRNRYHELGDGGTTDATYFQKFTEHINNDLDTPKALALAWDMLGDASVTDANKKVTLAAFDTVLKIGLDKNTVQADIPADIAALITERETARAEKNWKAADDLRAKIEEQGYTVKDTDNGQKIEKR